MDSGPVIGCVALHPVNVAIILGPTTPYKETLFA